MQPIELVVACCNVMILVREFWQNYKFSEKSHEKIWNETKKPLSLHPLNRNNAAKYRSLKV